MPRPAILMFGATGQVARETLRQGESAGFDIVALSRQDVNLTDADAVRRAVADAPANVCAVLNAAAYTAVDAAETDEKAARAVNAVAPGAMARSCAARGLTFVHLSTDYVFDGSKSGPYIETDTPNPVSAYGRTKLEGERAVLEALPDAVVIRTAWVFSSHGRNFVRTMVRLADRPRLTVVDDQRGCPTPASAIADAALRVIAARQNNAAAPGGVFHFAGDEAVTWRQFAEEIFARMARSGHAVPDVAPIATAEYPTAAARPANSVLDCSKIAAAYGIRPADWRTALDRDLASILEQQEAA